MEKSGRELMVDRTTRLDAALDEIMRIADNHGTAMNLARTYGNEHGDMDRVRATRGMIEEVIRRLIPGVK